MTEEQKRGFMAALQAMFENTGIQVKDKATLGDSLNAIKVEFSFTNPFFKASLSVELGALDSMNTAICELAQTHLGFTPALINWNNSRDIMWFYKKA